MELSNVTIISLHFTSNQEINNGNVVFRHVDGTKGQLATLNMIQGVNILTLNYHITKRFRIDLFGRRPGFSSPAIINGKYQFELSTLFI